MPSDEKDNSKRPAPGNSALIESWKRAMSEHRWMRNTFSREKLVEAAKNLAWVAPLTLLIWVWAEREQTQELTLNDVPVQITSNDPNRVVEIAAASPPKVVLRLKGPQATLDRVRERIMAGIPRGIEIDVGNSLGRGAGQSVNIVDRIQNQALFRETGVTVTESQPAVLTVNVDDRAKRDVDIEVPPTVTNLNLASTTFDPRKVTIEGPDSVLKRLEAQGELKVYADITPNSDAVRTPGKHDVPSLSLRLARDEHNVTINPQTVHAVLDVRAADVELPIESIPISVQAPPAFWRLYDVVLPNGESVYNVTVTGPQQQIDQLKTPRSYPAKAILELKSDDFGHEQPKRLKFDLGDGVRVKDEDASRPVEFRITKRDAGAG